MTSFRSSTSEYYRRMDMRNEYQVNDYDLEFARLQSFSTSPTGYLSNHSFIRLAANGFYYNQSLRVTECFLCGVLFPDRLPYLIKISDVHRRISPFCRFGNSEEDSEESSTRPHVSTERPNQWNEYIHAEREETLTIPPHDHQTSSLRESTESGYQSRTSGVLKSSQKMMKIQQTIHTQDSGSNEGSQLMFPSSTQSALPTGSGSSRAVHASQRYPEYQNSERRTATYKNWPLHLYFLHPLDLSECGFFYSNFGDCVRCYHCGIGLHNWESDDNPWVEHARWSRNCPYLIQRKGQEFIDSVLTALGIHTDAEIEESAHTPPIPLIQPQNQISKDTETARSRSLNEGVEETGAFGQTQIFPDDNIDAYLESPAVKANLQCAENKATEIEFVRKALKILRLGGNVTPSASLIFALVLELKDHNKEIEESLKERSISKEEIRKAMEKNICVVCTIRDRIMLFCPCRHLICCEECSSIISTAPNPKCPYCRKNITDTMKVFIN